VARADETVSGGERIFLAQLAHLLGLDAAAATELERVAVERIAGGAS
jgi:phosphoserine phosphatase